MILCLYPASNEFMFLCSYVLKKNMFLCSHVFQKIMFLCLKKTWSYVFMLLSDFEILSMYIAYGYRVATEIHNELTVA